MTLIPKLRSLNVLVLIGFMLVALPLIAAIILTTGYVDRLTRDSAHVVAASVQVARNVQLVLEQVTSLERNARQYHVLGDTELLSLYENRHARLLNILIELEQLLSKPNKEIRQLRITANHLQTLLQQETYDSATVANALQRFDTLNAKARALTASLGDHINQSLSDLEAHAEAAQRILYWQAAALIPWAIILAAIFTVLIAKPIRQLGDAIHRLGAGNMKLPIEIKGPLDLEALGKRLDWLRNRLHELEQEKNEFLGHVSHELKTPLANIREAAELLEDGSVGVLSDKQHEVIAILETNSLSLQKKIENLLHFSAWQDMKARLHYVLCKLREITENVVTQHQLAIQRLNLKINLQLSEFEICADSEKLHVMLDNLVSNAVKFSPPGGTIYIKAMQDKHYTDIHIADQGPGIAVAERSRVFDAFYQGNQPQNSHVRGTGIGLAVVRECARAHGGYVQILDGEFTGAHFLIRLPIISATEA